MIKEEQAFTQYMETYFKSRSLKEYRDIPEVRERILQDSLNGTVPDTPGQHSIHQAIIELERQIRNKAWAEKVHVVELDAKPEAVKQSRRLFGLFKAKESVNKQNQAENRPTPKRK